LNQKAYEAYGIEPFAKEFDSWKTFRCKIKNLPKKLEKLKFNIILANMVYSINYTSHFSKNFKWELKYKKKILNKLFGLLNDKGFLILLDDIGTIFSKSDLNKHFQILFFEKDIEVINFDTNNIEDFGKITILRKR
jgi:HJR/Mrr/RecB family endonuclease